MSKVTVLMAVYNAEKYLHQSLDSLIRQTLKDIQVVCIDDASTDSSFRILNDYAAKDDRINVIHLNENHGQAYARNEGLRIADGEFVAMLDADDWLSVDALQQGVEVFREHPETDSILFDLQIIEADGKVHGYAWHYATDNTYPLGDGSFEVMDGKTAFLASLSWGIHGVTMDRAELYRIYPYDITCRYYSDDNTARLHFLSSREVRCSKAKYFYRQHPDSVSHQISVNHMDWIIAADSMRRQLEELNMGDDIMNVWEWERWKIIVGCFWFLFVNRSHFSPTERRHCIEEIKKGWQSTDINRLKGRPIMKLGWYPLPGHWQLFRLEEAFYFSLRYLLGRR